PSAVAISPRLGYHSGEASALCKENPWGTGHPGADSGGQAIRSYGARPDRSGRIVMPKRQRQLKRGTVHTITGPARKAVRARFMGFLRTAGPEQLVFERVRRAKN